MRRIATRMLSAAPLAGFIFALAMTVNAAVAFAGDFDGNWTVRVITERGKCDATSSYDVHVANGRVLYTSYTSLSMYGTVSPDGAVRVVIRHFDDGANGSGRLSKRSGRGAWRGVGKDGPCSGRWEARRQSVNR
jgi:hypothetical protein